MQWSPMSLSRSPSYTSRPLALALAAAGATGCGDDSCGPSGAPAIGLVASNDAVTLTYGQLTSGLNNDCPAAGAPSGVISMTIAGTQSDGSGLVTLCIGRPDLLAHQALGLGGDTASAEVRVIDLTGTANNCALKLDVTQSVSGTATTSGLCGNGGDPAGFALVLDGAVTLTRTCGAAIDSVAVTVRGRVAVAGPR